MFVCLFFMEFPLLNRNKKKKVFSLCGVVCVVARCDVGPLRGAGRPPVFLAGGGEAWPGEHRRGGPAGTDGLM